MFKRLKKNTLVLLLIGLTISLSACRLSVSDQSIDSVDNTHKNDKAPTQISTPKNLSENEKESIINFSLNLFRENFDDENMLISPLSIVSALGMVNNGAVGDTSEQIRTMLNINQQELNEYLKSYVEYLPNGEGYQTNLVNSIWFKDTPEITIREDFLQTNADYYDAQISRVPFDESTKNDINAWIKNETEGMIDSLLEEPIPKDTVMYLINALSIQAEWEAIYEENQVLEEKFTPETDEKQMVELMYSSEHTYLENENLIGVVKPYKDNRYAFVALLPKGELSIEELLKLIDGEDLIDLIDNQSEEQILTAIPKFSFDYDISLTNSLRELGMIDAFDQKQANFSDLVKSSEGNIYIDRILHKTAIDLDEKGTKAGAVTAIAMAKESETISSKPAKEVILDRPFFYLIVDTEEKLPLFMGSFMNSE